MMKTSYHKTAEMLFAEHGLKKCAKLIKNYLDINLARETSHEAFLEACSEGNLEKDKSNCNIAADSSSSASTSTHSLSPSSASNLMSQDTRPSSTMSLEEIQANLRNLIKLEESKDNRLEILKEREQQEIKLFQDKLQDIVAKQNDKIRQIKADYELEQQRREIEHKDQIRNEEKILDNLLTKLQEDVRAMKERHQKVKDDEISNFSRGQKRKRELQEELQTRITPLLATSNTTADTFSLIPECYVCFENCRPPLKLMTCGTGHIVCEPCFQLMERKICGKCRSSITGRATDIEEMIRKILKLEETTLE